MKRSFPSRFYRERRDISTLSVLQKSVPSCTIGRGMRDGERMDSERTGWKRYRTSGGSYSGVGVSDINGYVKASVTAGIKTETLAEVEITVKKASIHTFR